MSIINYIMLDSYLNAGIISSIIKQTNEADIDSLVKEYITIYPINIEDIIPTCYLYKLNKTLYYLLENRLFIRFTVSICHYLHGININAILLYAISINPEFKCAPECLLYLYTKDTKKLFKTSGIIDATELYNWNKNYYVYHDMRYLDKYIKNMLFGISIRYTWIAACIRID